MLLTSSWLYWSQDWNPVRFPEVEEHNRLQRKALDQNLILLAHIEKQAPSFKQHVSQEYRFSHQRTTLDGKQDSLQTSLFIELWVLCSFLFSCIVFIVTLLYCVNSLEWYLPGFLCHVVFCCCCLRLLSSNVTLELLTQFKEGKREVSLHVSLRLSSVSVCLSFKWTFSGNGSSLDLSAVFSILCGSSSPWEHCIVSCLFPSKQETGKKMRFVSTDIMFLWMFPMCLLIVSLFLFLLSEISIRGGWCFCVPVLFFLIFLLVFCKWFRRRAEWMTSQGKETHLLPLLLHLLLHSLPT